MACDAEPVGPLAALDHLAHRRELGRAVGEGLGGRRGGRLGGRHEESAQVADLDGLVAVACEDGVELAAQMRVVAPDEPLGPGARGRQACPRAGGR